MHVCMYVCMYVCVFLKSKMHENCIYKIIVDVICLSVYSLSCNKIASEILNHIVEFGLIEWWVLTHDSRVR